MSISRGWTPIEEDSRWENEDYYEDIKPKLDALVREWSQCATEEEEEGFRRSSDDYDDSYGIDWPVGRWYERGEEDPEYLADLARAEADYAAVQGAIRARRASREVRMEIIEALLEHYGARLMRPYEHHNEMESYYEYMEA